MSLSDDLTAEVSATFKSPWDESVTGGVPDPADLRLNSNDAKDLEEATVLYADLDGSTNMVDSYKWWFSAEIYKTFLRCAGQVIRSEGGAVTAYDGDRVMAIFTGGSKNTSAARCALKINYAVQKIIKPAIAERYSKTQFDLKHVVGIDTSRLRAARIGVHGDNDIVWIGRAANYAAKLTNISGKSTWITDAVYKRLAEELKTTKGTPMWVPHDWTANKGIRIHSSTWTWSF